MFRAARGGPSPSAWETCEGRRLVPGFLPRAGSRLKHTLLFCVFACCQVRPYIVQTSRSEHSGAPGSVALGHFSPTRVLRSSKLRVSRTCCLLCCAWGQMWKKKERGHPRPHPSLPPLCCAAGAQRCTAHTVCTHPVKGPAINKERAIYEHFLSAALWKHITWRRDPLTPSCHSTLSMRQRSQIYRVRGRGRRCRSRPAMASHLTIIGPAAVEKKKKRCR